jgi:hypothetical protein
MNLAPYRLTFLGNDLTLSKSNSRNYLELVEVPVRMANILCSSNDAEIDEIRMKLVQYGFNNDANGLRSINGVPGGVLNKPEFVDYSRPGVLEVDSLHSQACLKDESAPSCKVECPKKNFDQLSFSQLADQFGVRASEIAEIVRFVFKNRDHGSFFGYDCVRRTYPSNGSRHGFEAALHISGGGIETLIFYDAESDIFFRTPLSAPDPIDSTVNLLVYIHWNRHFWRYRDSWYYNTILLEAGHLLANLELLAIDKGIISTIAERPEYGIDPHHPWETPFMRVFF